jgi:inorganic pyrophosphatase
MNTLNLYKEYIGKTVTVTMDRPLGSLHPKYGFMYPVNYGYIPNTISGDGEELDAYVLNVDEPKEQFKGICVAIVHRFNDNDDKLIVIPENTEITNEEIEKQIDFQEKWFKHILVRNPEVTKTHFGVYGRIIDNNKILLIKKIRGPYTGLYDLPGGSPEKGESYAETLIREIKEETGCDVAEYKNEQSKSIVFSDFTRESCEIGVLQHRAVLFDVTISGKPQTKGDGLDSGGAVWIDIDELNEDNATPYALIAANKSLISLADENDNVIATGLRGTPLKQGRFVMIAAVLLFNSRGNLILQKIAAHKKWGGLWTYSAAGHVDAGEDYATAAKRELAEEMGIKADLEKEVAVVPVIRAGRQIAFHHVFIARSDDKIVADESEVAEVKEISLDELKLAVKQHSEDFLDAFVEALKPLL